MSNDIVIVEKPRNPFERQLFPDDLISYSMRSFETPQEFKNYILSLRISEEDKLEVIEHENAHYSQAVKEGFKPRFVLWERNYRNGETLYAPSTEFRGTEKYKDKLIRVISAPKDMSPSDRRQLEALLKEQSEINSSGANMN